MPGTDTQHGTVIAAFGRRTTLRLADGVEVAARIRGRKLQAVCGDRVVAVPMPNEPDWLIEAIEPRRNELTRPNSRGKTEVLAANLDLLVAVCADPPKPDWFIIDRYLCAAELMRIASAVVYNKADSGEIPPSIALELAIYRHLDYPSLACSARTGHRLDELLAVAAGKTAIIVGQSGVGKSSLINALTLSDQRTAEISAARGEGRHTTVTSVMLDLPDGGTVIDSPGVRDYAPAVETSADVESGFSDVRAFGQHCRFSNCRHRREPGCAVKDAVDSGSVSARRYESYRRMLHLVERQERSRY